MAAVGFLLAGAVVFYLQAPGAFTYRAVPSTTAEFSPSPAPTRVRTETATPGGLSPSAGPSPTPAASTPTPGKTPRAGNRGSSDPAEESISVAHPPPTAKPFETVRIQGTYSGGAVGTLLRVQQLERGRWLAFPLTASTDESGQFTAYVELGEAGSYWLRVLDPDSNVKSKPFLVVIKA